MAEIDALISKQALKDINALGHGLDVVIERLDKTIIKSKDLDESISKLNKSTKNFAQKTKQVSDANKKATKVNKQLTMAEDDVVKAKLKHQKATKEQRDRIKDLIAVENKEVGTLAKLKKANKQLRVERDSLNIETDKGRKRLEEINNQIDENNDKLKENYDSLTKQKINIGNYGSALDGLDGIMGGFIGQLKGMLEGFKGMGPAMDATNKGGKKVKRTFWQITKIPLILLLTAIVGAVAGLIAVFKRSEKGSNSFRRNMAQISGVLDVLAGRVLKVANALILMFQGKNIEGAKKMREAFTGVKDEIETTVMLTGELADLNTELRYLGVTAVKTVSDLQKESEMLAAVADDATKSFSEREEAAEKSMKLGETAARIQYKMAKAEYDQLKAKNAFLDKAGKLTLELREAEAQKYAEVNELEKQWMLLQVENHKRLGELKQDRLEKDLDILIDGYDNYKTVNEKIISDEKVSIDKRKALLSELISEGEKTWAQQIKTIKQFTNVQFNETDLLAEKNAKVLNERIRSLGLSEIIEGRLLEIIRERRMVMSDTLEMMKEVNSTLTDGLKKIKPTAEEIDTTALESMEHVKTQNDYIIDQMDRAAQRSLQNFEDVTRGVSDLANQGTELFAVLQERQSAKLEKEKNRQLKAAGDNEEKKAKIEEKFAKKQLEIKRRIAVADKLNAIFGITINTALAITKALPNPVLVALTAALGAMSLATVIAQPLPQFWKGTKSSPEGWASVGEKGRELKIDPYGGVSLTDNKPQLDYLRRGTQIIPNQQTEMVLRSLGQDRGMNDVSSEIRTSNDRVIEAIRSKKEFHIYPDKRKITERSGSYYTEYLNAKLHG